jgi:N-methylhydantoinase A
MRYPGQAYELTIPFSHDLPGAFHAAHQRAYGYALPQRPVEVVNVRLHAVGLVEKPHLEAEPPAAGADAGPARLGFNAAGPALYDRERLPVGSEFNGPALLFQYDSTVYIPPRWSGRVDGYRNCILERTTS